MAVSRAVHANHQHRMLRGDCMEQKYAATYRFPGSKTVVHIVAPPPLTEEEKESILREYDCAFWAAWNSLTVEDRVRINARVSKAE